MKVYIGGLHTNNTKRHFAQHSTVADCYIVQNCNAGESRGFGFVTFRKAAHAARALSIREQFIEGESIFAQPCKLKAKKDNVKVEIEK